METEGYFRFLRGISLFGNLSDADIRDIMKYCREAVFEPGTAVFHENDEADRFYMVMDGEVEVWKNYGTENADMIAVHGIGYLFGEMALVDDLPRSATVIARGQLRLLHINKDEFQKILQENSRVAFSIVRSVSAMVRKSNETLLEDLKERNAKLEAAYEELKEAQAELLRNERLSTLGKFSSMILHDIRNPLAVLKGYTDLILSGTMEDAKLKEYVVKMRYEIERLNSLANEFLDYSRGEVRLDMSVVSLKDFCSRLASSVTRRFASQAIKVSVVSDYDHPVVFDYERMFRVLMNLAENSRKALGRSGEFSIQASRRGDSLVFEVRDTGTGMSPEVMSHIFEPFYSHASGGTGLGMAIVKSIVDAHEGNIAIQSEPSKGTCVTISIPLRG
ncbi:MAG TPA: ATP-binding protein [Spirochaetia bacterium]|nr:ATP-binding protein [Spirochaetia bacterium]